VQGDDDARRWPDSMALVSKNTWSSPNALRSRSAIRAASDSASVRR
jgi:hypothetical protein